MITINMEMPKNCAECPMYQSEDSDYCDITGEWITGEEMIRHKDCPLVEIVTCKDCKHRRGEVCRNYRHIINNDFYCKDGIRKE